MFSQSIQQRGSVDIKSALTATTRNRNCPVCRADCTAFFWGLVSWDRKPAEPGSVKLHQRDGGVNLQARGFGNESIPHRPSALGQIWQDIWHDTPLILFYERFWEREYPTSALHRKSRRVVRVVLLFMIDDWWWLMIMCSPSLNQKKMVWFSKKKCDPKKNQLYRAKLALVYLRDSIESRKSKGLQLWSPLFPSRSAYIASIFYFSFPSFLPFSCLSFDKWR